jgi:hypothetical protein
MRTPVLKQLHGCFEIGVNRKGSYYALRKTMFKDQRLGQNIYL